MRLTLTTLALLFSALLSAQAPALIPYQAIARNAAGEPLASSTLNARFTIHDGTATGTNVWQELQTVYTSELGLFTVQLGSSVPFTSVNWDNGAKFMQVELDLGSGFIDLGTQQLLSVPYALHAGSVHLNVSATGDTLFVGDGSYIIIPGLSEANNNADGGGTTTGTTLHTCGELNVHNPNLTYGSMTDQEGNVYKTIVIGTQEWMAENLKTSIYRNGDAILTGNTAWLNGFNNMQGTWAYLDNDPSNECPYGRLYNWFACTDSRELCPVGWHVPTKDEWRTLITFLDPNAYGGGNNLNSINVAGGQMKTTGTIENSTGFWAAPNTAATNSCGFSALPGDGFNANFLFYGYNGFWWSSSEDNGADGRGFLLDWDSVRIGGGSYYKNWGFSVRCLRD
jgi:uncharacterized protein (TIGR02145 family)